MLRLSLNDNLWFCSGRLDGAEALISPVPGAADVTRIAALAACLLSPSGCTSDRLDSLEGEVVPVVDVCPVIYGSSGYRW